jgi:hypothetical protein
MLFLMMLMMLTHGFLMMAFAGFTDDELLGYTKSNNSGHKGDG